MARRKRLRELITLKQTHDGLMMMRKDPRLWALFQGLETGKQQESLDGIVWIAANGLAHAALEEARRKRRLF
jgi:hypothetical protein